MENVEFNGKGVVIFSTETPAISFNLINEPDVKQNCFTGFTFYNLNKKKLGDRFLLWLLSRRGVNL